MSKLVIHDALLRVVLRTLKLRTDASPDSRLHEALETLNTEIDLWAVSGNGLNMLVDDDKQSSIEVSEELVRAAMLVAARRSEAPSGTALRNSLEQLAAELDTWAVDGSLNKR